MKRPKQEYCFSASPIYATKREPSEKKRITQLPCHAKKGNDLLKRQGDECEEKGGSKPKELVRQQNPTYYMGDLMYEVSWYQEGEKGK